MPTDLQRLFLSCVDTVRKDLAVKYEEKMVEPSSFEEFKKQDKIKVLFKFIQNDQALKAVYDAIFKKNQLVERIQRLSNKLHFEEKVPKLSNRRGYTYNSLTLSRDERS